MKVLVCVKPRLMLPLLRLQKLIPSVSIKENVSQLDIILEAIRYIAKLATKLEAEPGDGEAVES